MAILTMAILTLAILCAIVGIAIVSIVDPLRAVRPPPCHTTQTKPKPKPKPKPTPKPGPKPKRKRKRKPKPSGSLSLSLSLSTSLTPPLTRRATSLYEVPPDPTPNQVRHLPVRGVACAQAAAGDGVRHRK